MKYFSRGWAAGEFSEAESDELRSRYWKRVEALRGIMPNEVIELATGVSLHDGIVDTVRWDQAKRGLELVLVCCGEEGKSSEVRLLYSGVQVSDSTLSVLAERARDRRTEILYDEVDQDEDDRWVHRLMFWPVGEISICFEKVDVTRAARADAMCRVGYDPFVLVD
jgi:hypothetical protein